MSSPLRRLACLGPPTLARADAAIWQGDALELLRRTPGGSIDLVVCSPGYNIGKSYVLPRRTTDEYVAWCADWLAEISRVLTPTGSAWINVGTTRVAGRGTAVPIGYLLWPHLADLQLIQTICWVQSNGVACRRRLSPRKEDVLWLVKNPHDYVFELDRIRDPNVKYPDQRRNGRLRCNPKGKNPSDTWMDINRVTAGRASPERTPHPAQMPLALAERIILAASQPGDIVLDPFAGAATTVVAARQLGRAGAGFEIEPAYISIAADRLHA